MPKAVPTVDRSKVQEAAHNPPPALPESPKVRFVRTMSADAPLDLGDGRTIRFEVPVSNVTGDRFAFGTYSTSDPDEIRELRKVVAEKPWLYVFEEPLT